MHVSYPRSIFFLRIGLCLCVDEGDQRVVFGSRWEGAHDGGSHSVAQIVTRSLFFFYKIKELWTNPPTRDFNLHTILSYNMRSSVARRELNWRRGGVTVAAVDPASLVVTGDEFFHAMI